MVIASDLFLDEHPEKEYRSFYYSEKYLIFSYSETPCSFGLSATSQQYFSLRINQPLATSLQYFSLRTNQHQPPATSQPNKLKNCHFSY
jgi:hypothetical protein